MKPRRKNKRLLQGMIAFAALLAIMQSPQPAMGRDAGIAHAIASGKALETTSAQSTLPHPFASVEVSSEEVRQGSVLVVRVTPSAQAQVTGEFAGVNMPFYPNDSDGEQKLIGLIGIDALAQPGMQPLTLTAYTDNGMTTVLTQSIRVIAGGYGIERVRIAAKLAALVDQTLNDEEAAEVRVIYRQFSPDKWWEGPFKLPVKGRLVSGYGNRRRYNGQDLGSYHSGLDISANAGTPVLAAAPGRVLAVREFKIRGNAVFIDHGRGVVTGYFHLSKITVEPEQRVNAGDPIGNVGTTGRSQGNHVHFDLSVGGATIDPAPWTRVALPE